jgi:hypothetical protein
MVGVRRRGAPATAVDQESSCLTPIKARTAIAYLPGADWWMALAVLIAIVPTAFPLAWWW